MKCQLMYLILVGQSFPDGTAYIANPSKYYSPKPTKSGYSGGKFTKIQNNLSADNPNSVAQIQMACTPWRPLLQSNHQSTVHELDQYYWSLGCSSY